MRETATLEALRAMGVLRGPSDEPWLELHTSGTSTVPRAVVRSLRSWTGSFDHVSRLTGLTPDDRILVPAAPRGSMFAFAHAHAAHVGAEVLALPRWSVAGAERASASCTAAHLTPAMLTALLDRDLGLLRTVVCAGAALPDAVRHRARAAGVTVVDYYGAAELSFAAMRVGERMEAFPEVEIEVRDGVIWVRSPWLADGYGQNQTGPMRRGGDGFATVGDRGRWDPAAGLVVVGRGDDTVTSGGTTVICADVEAALLSCEGVAAVAVVGTPHPGLGELLEAVVVGRPGLDLPALSSRSSGLVDAGHRPRRWHQWPELPLTPLGKVDRRAVRDRLIAERRQGQVS